MPGTFFTTQERERLAGFPEDIHPWDLITYCTLTEHDRALIDTYHGDANRLGTALQLCAVRRCNTGGVSCGSVTSSAVALLEATRHLASLIAKTGATK